MPEWIVKYWVEWLFGLVLAILGACYKRLSGRFKREREERLAKAQKDEEELKALKDGMRSILKRQLIADCETAERQGYCEQHIKEAIVDMFDCYAALGGNGTIPPMVERVKALPTFAPNDGRPSDIAGFTRALPVQPIKIS